MPQEQHTPGPWLLKGEIRRIGDTHHYCADITDGRPSEGYRGSIALIQTADHLTHGMRIDEGRANARLIAAAPEMLAALKHAAQNMPHPDQMIDDAIAKAEGPSTRRDGPVLREGV